MLFCKRFRAVARLLLPLVLLGFAVASPSRSQEPWFEPPHYAKLTEAQKQRVKQRDAEQTTISRLRIRNIGRAVEMTREMLRRDIAAFGERHEEVAKSAHFASGIFYRNNDFRASVGLEQDEMAIYAQLYGEDNWRVYSSKTRLNVLKRMVGQGRQPQRDTYGQAWTDYNKAGDLRASDKRQALAAATAAIDGMRTGLAELGISPRVNPDLALTLLKRADIYHYWNDHAKAVEDVQAAMKIIEIDIVDEDGNKLYGYGRQHPMYARALRTLAGVKTSAGQFAEAKRHYRQALDILDRCHPGPHRDKPAILINLSHMMGEEQERADAVKLLLQVLEIQQSCDDPYDSKTAAAMYHLTGNYQKTGQSERASEVLAELLKFTAEKLGRTSMIYGQAKDLQGRSLMLDGAYDEAAKCFSTGAGIFYKKYGKENIDYAFIAHQLGWAYYKAGRKDDAEPYLRGAVESILKYHGRHRLLWNAVDRYETFLQETIANACRSGSFDAARQAARKAVELRTQTNGDKHYRVAHHQSRLALIDLLEELPEEDRLAVLDAEADFDKAVREYSDENMAQPLETFKKTLAVRQQHLPTAVYLIAEAQARLGFTAEALGRYALAAEHLRPATATFWKLLERNQPPLSAASYVAMGDVMTAAGDFAEARQWYEGGEAHMRRLHGTRHQAYAEALVHHAELLSRRGELVEAEIRQREALTIRKRVSGESSQICQSTICDLAWSLTRLGQLDEAQQLYEQVQAAIEATDAEKAFEFGGPGTQTRVRVATRRAVLERYQGRPGDSAKRLQEFLASTPEGEQWDDSRLFALVELGAAELEMDRLDDAQAHLRDALALVAKNNLSAESALEKLVAAVERKSLALLDAGEFGDAAKQYSQLAATHSQFLGDDHWRTRHSRWIAGGLDALAKLPAEKQQIASAALAAAGQAAQARKSGKFAEALKQAEQAQQQWQALGSDGWLADAAGCLRAELLAAVGNVTAAGEAWQRIAAARQKALPGDPWAVAALTQSAAHARLRGDQSAAKESLLEALTILAKHREVDSIAYARVQLELSNWYLQASRLTDADLARRQAETCLLPIQADYPDDFCGVLEQRVKLLLAQKENAQAMSFAKRAHAYGQRHCDRDSLAVARATLLLARCELAGSAEDHGEANLRTALERIKAQAGESSLLHAEALALLADCQLRAGRVDEAAELLERAGQIANSALGERSDLASRLLRSKAALAMARGATSQAAVRIDLSLKMLRDMQSTETLAYLDALLASGDQALRSGDQQRASAMYREAVERGFALANRTGAAQIERQRPIAGLRDALDRYLSLESSWRNADDVYAYVLRWKGMRLAHRKRLQRARGEEKTAGLVNRWDRATGRLATIATRLPFPEEEAFWIRQVNFLTERRDRLELDILRATDGKSPTCPAPAELKKALPADVALLDFVLYTHVQPDEDDPPAWRTERRYASVIVRAGQPTRIVQLGAAEPLEGDIEAWRAASRAMTDAFFDLDGSAENGDAFDETERNYLKIAKRLSSGLWQPVAEAVGKTETVLVSPDGTLAAMPFAALFDKETNYLVRHHTFVTVPAARFLPETLNTPKPRAVSEDVSMLLFGGIDFSASPQARVESMPTIPQNQASSDDPMRVGSSLVGPDAFRDLLGTKLEVDALVDFINELSPQAKVQKFTGDAGTENEYRRQAGAHRWMHFATHGFFLDSFQADAHARRRARTLPGGGQQAFDRNLLPAVLWRPDLTVGLTFAGANQPNTADQDDGILWGMEVGANDLSGVELAVLSGCETASGRTLVGEGALSMRRAFQVAGVRTIVSTLWPVNDLATDLYMRRFYRNVLARGMSKADALREAQLWFITAARKKPSGSGIPTDQELTVDADKLPVHYLLPSIWAPFVINGDWR